MTRRKPKKSEVIDATPIPFKVRWSPKKKAAIVSFDFDGKQYRTDIIADAMSAEQQVYMVMENGRPAGFTVLQTNICAIDLDGNLIREEKPRGRRTTRRRGSKDRA